jgi:PAS domain S-box-containing protein
MQGLSRWRHRAGLGFAPLAALVLGGILALTLYASSSLAESGQRQSQSHFESLASESEQALTSRLTSYANALRSGAGIFQSSDFVSPGEWHTFVGALRLREDYPGMLGLGWVDSGVVSYLEPEAVTGLPLGLDLRNQRELRDAAARAADEGATVISPSMLLGFDDDLAGAFVLLQPVYRAGTPLDSAATRRAALRGFVFAPFQARGLFADLTSSQGRRLDVSLLAGTDSRALFTTASSGSEPGFTVERKMSLFGANWTLRWQSTLEFERAEAGGNANFVLIGGLLFTGLFAVLLLVLGARRQPAQGLMRPLSWLLPIVAFLLVTGLSLAAWALLSNAEHKNLSSHVESEARRLETDLERQVRARMQSIRRMSHRWSAGGGTPYAVWRGDARDMLQQIEGLEQLQWIGPDFNTHWSEGSRRRVTAAIAELRNNPAFARGLQESADHGAIFVTEPREFEPGNSVFDVYVPVTREGRFDGFLSATFTTRGFFGDAVGNVNTRSFAFKVRYLDKVYFDDAAMPAANSDWQREGGFKLQDRQWSFSVSPTQRFVDEQETPLPLIVLIAGLLVASLSAFLVRYVLVARSKAARLQSSALALSASEERYELALKGMSVGLWDWDVITNAVFLSQRCRDILCVTNAELAPSYKGFMARVHPDDRVRVEKALAEHLKRHQPFDLEFRIRRDDGEYVCVHSYGQAKFVDGVAVRMAGSLQDITSQTRQAQELNRSREKLDLLVENTPAAIAMFDNEMRYLMTSRRWVQDYGLEGRDIIGLSHYKVFPEIETLPQWRDAHRRALRGEMFESREDSWTREDGRKEWIQWAIHPWKNADGEVGGIVMFTEVITARKQAEEALRATEAMNRAAMDRAPIGKALVQIDGRFTKVNPALCQLVGYSESELLTMSFQAITHPDDLAQNLSSLQALIQGKSVTYQVEKRYIHRDGRILWGSLSVSAVRGADGHVECLMAQVQDITESKIKDRAQSEFLAVVSDELRAPIASLREILAAIAERADLLPTTLRNLFEDGREHVQRLSTLVAEIVDVGHLTQGQLRIEFKDEDIGQITRQAVSVNEAYPRIALENMHAGLLVYVDAARYSQLLSNLLANAAQFSPPGSRVDVSCELRGEWVRVSVRDRGEGIPEEFRARIFNKFAHADSTSGRFKSGAGLGLYIARQLVEQMRGRIGFISHGDEGTTFWVEFPHMSRSESRLTA